MPEPSEDSSSSSLDCPIMPSMLWLDCLVYTSMFTTEGRHFWETASASVVSSPFTVMLVPEPSLPSTVEEPGWMNE